MLANRNIDLGGLAEVTSLEHDRENVVGVWLPRLRSFEVKVKDYSLLGRPFWVDVAAARLRDCVELNLRLSFARRRAEILERAVRRITQRVNLFEKILIPRTRKNIHRIQVYLGDAERAAVVRSKVAKRKRAAA
jgi:V/A-type H+-transporting ATPase subunit D